MINKFTIDLKQFNNGEGDRITFPTFDQCLAYGMHKLKGAFEAGVVLTDMIVIADSLGRRVTIVPSPKELYTLHSLHHGRNESADPIVLKIDRDRSGDGIATFLF